MENNAGYTPDGSHLTYVSTHGDGDQVMVANADGTNPVEIALIPNAGNAQGAFSPDGRTFALFYDITGKFEHLTWTTGLPEWQRLAP